MQKVTKRISRKRQNLEKNAAAVHASDPLVTSLRRLRDDHYRHHLWDTSSFVADKIATLTHEPVDYLILANIHVITNHHERAIHVIELNDLCTHFTMASYLLARCYEQCHQRTAALKVLETLISLDAAGKLDAASELERSKVEFALAPESIKLSALVFNLKGTLLFLQNQQQLAKECFVAALERDVCCYDAFKFLKQFQLLDKTDCAELLGKLRAVCNGEKDKQLFVDLYALWLEKDAHKTSKSKLIETFGSAHDADVQSAKAVALWRKCAFKQALDITTDLIESGGADDETLLLHIHCLVEVGAKNHIYILAQQQIHQAPQAILSWYAVACYCFLLNQSETAKMYFSKTTQMSSIFVPGLVGLGHVFMRRHEFDAAYRCYSTAVKQMPGSYEPYMFLAICERYTGSSSSTSPQEQYFLEMALEKSMGDDPDLLNECGVSAYRSGLGFTGDDASFKVAMFEKAIEFFQQAIAVAFDPSLENQRVARASWQLGGGSDTHKTKAVFGDQTVTIGWDCLYVNLAYAHLQLYVELGKDEHLNNALAAFRKVLSLNPNATDAHLGLGYLHHYARKPEFVSKALACYQAALSLAPQSPVANQLMKRLQVDIEKEYSVDFVDRLVAKAKERIELAFNSDIENFCGETFLGKKRDLGTASSNEADLDELAEHQKRTKKARFQADLKESPKLDGLSFPSFAADGKPKDLLLLDSSNLDLVSTRSRRNRFLDRMLSTAAASSGYAGSSASRHDSEPKSTSPHDGLMFGSGTRRRLSSSLSASDSSLMRATPRGSKIKGTAGASSAGIAATPAGGSGRGVRGFSAASFLMVPSDSSSSSAVNNTFGSSFTETSMGGNIPLFTPISKRNGTAEVANMHGMMTRNRLLALNFGGLSSGSSSKLGSYSKDESFSNSGNFSELLGAPNSTSTPFTTRTLDPPASSSSPLQFTVPAPPGGSSKSHSSNCSRPASSSRSSVKTRSTWKRN